MDLQPVIAQDFTTASPFLIQVLKLYAVPGNFESLKCLDIPSGDGRNTFLLAESFKEVTAIDINKKHLVCYR
jgi:ubiquinone/menaquinone biosynthesis C-methylase UbiE